jgi:hypothetical protein
MEKQRFRLLGLPTSDTPSVMNLGSRTSSAEAANHKNQSGVYVKQSSGGMAKTIFLTSTFPKEVKRFRKFGATLLYQAKKVLIEWISEILDWTSI